jgi:regulator of protease activity HflC (stomatin/prohibitin superfamily)
MEFNLSVFIAQCINFAVIFFLFKWLLWDTLTKGLLARKEQLKKLLLSQHIVQEATAEAEKEKERIIQEGIAYKHKLLEEAKAQAANLETELVQAAKYKASQYLEDAKKKAADLDRELKEWFVDWVKATTKLVVNKLFEKDVNLKDEYVQELVNEFTRQNK